MENKIVEPNGPVRISLEETIKLWPELIGAIEDRDFTFTGHWKPVDGEPSEQEGGD